MFLLLTPVLIAGRSLPGSKSVVGSSIPLFLHLHPDHSTAGQRLPFYIEKGSMLGTSDSWDAQFLIMIRTLHVKMILKLCISLVLGWNYVAYLMQEICG